MASRVTCSIRANRRSGVRPTGSARGFRSSPACGPNSLSGRRSSTFRCQRRDDLGRAAPGADMKRDLLLIAPLYGPTQAHLEAVYEVHHLWEATDRGELLRRIAPRVEVAVTTGGAGAARTLMEQLPQLRLIACFGVGVDAIDLAAARERGVAVTNTPDVLTDDVADLAIGLMLATLRGIAAADRYVRAGNWPRANMALQSKVSGKAIGIVGMGRIGQAIARRAAAFDMAIAWKGPHPKPATERDEPDLVALARSVDVLVAACPGGAATRGLVSRAVLEALGPKGVFVNISRG